MKFMNNPGLIFGLTFSFLFQANSLFSQGKVQPTFASPNAAALGKYGDIPVNNHTGVPSISVPFDIDKQGLPVGIQLIGKYMDESSLLQYAHILHINSNFSLNNIGHHVLLHQN